jgi:photosystem II stability/assembly factor-like uncharacterized protein
MLGTILVAKSTSSNLQYYRSADDGASFAVRTAPAVIGTRFVADDQGNFYFYQYRNGLYRSADQGLTFALVGTPNDLNGDNSGAPVITQSGAIIIPGGSFSGGPYLYRSTDGGSTWTQVQVDNLKIIFDPQDILESQTQAGQLIYLIDDRAGNVYQYRSADGGVTWARSTPFAAWNPIGCFGYTQANLISTKAGSWLARLVLNPTGVQRLGIFRSADGGVTWAKQYDQQGAFSGSDFAQADAAARIITQGLAGTPLYSDDDGVTWTALSSVPGSGSGDYAATADAFIAGTSDGNTYRSLTNGTSWTPVATAQLGAMAVLARPPLFWGVDSGDVVTQSFFDAVKNQLGVPAFWGRYIGKHGTLKKGEVDLLHRNECKILIIFADTGIGQLVSKAQAMEQAREAIKAAHDLGVPNGVYIYADTEYPAQSPTTEWFAGWFETLQGSPYGAGVYGNTSPGAVPKFGKTFCDAYPHFPSPAQAYVYANQPQRTTPDQLCNPTYRTFTPDVLPCNPPTVVFQYTTGTGLGCPVPTTSHFVDLDLANAAGFASMW